MSGSSLDPSIIPAHVDRMVGTASCWQFRVDASNTLQLTAASRLQGVVSGSGVGKGERVGLADGATVGKIGGSGFPAVNSKKSSPLHSDEPSSASPIRVVKNV